MINKTKYFLPPFATDWLAISAALLMTGPKRVGPARETLSRALVYAIIIPWMPSTCKKTNLLKNYLNMTTKARFNIFTSQQWLLPFRLKQWETGASIGRAPNPHVGNRLSES